MVGAQRSRMRWLLGQHPGEGAVQNGAAARVAGQRGEFGSQHPIADVGAAVADRERPGICRPALVGHLDELFRRSGGMRRVGVPPDRDGKCLRWVWPDAE